LRYLLLILVGALILRLIFFTGLQGSDDLSYTNYAYTIVQGTYELKKDVFTLRYGLLLPTAFFQGLLGVNIISSVLWVLICGLVEIVLVYILARHFFHHRAGLIAAFLVSIFPEHLFFSTEMHADIPMCMWIGTSALLFLKADRSKGRVLGLLSGFALGAGYLTKEPAFFILVFYIVGALLWPRLRLGLLYTILGFALVFLFEFTFYAIATGTATFRLEAMYAGHLQALYPHYPTTTSVLNRMFIQIPSMLFWPFCPLFPYFAGFYLFFIPCAIFMLRCRVRTAYPLLLWWLVLFCMISFFPITLKPFTPAFNAHPRTLEPLTLPAFALLGYWLYQLGRWKRYLSIVLLMLISLAAMYVLNHDARGWRRTARKAYDYVKEKGIQGPIFTDPRTAEMFRFWDGYRSRFKISDLYSVQLREQIKGYVIANYRWLNALREFYGTRIPEELIHPPDSWSEIFRYHPPKRPRLRSLSFKPLFAYVPDRIHYLVIYRIGS
jgi:4-amino-4-deoxy-L-arabinose transferase-like glycosyltransferase